MDWTTAALTSQCPFHAMPMESKSLAESGLRGQGSLNVRCAAYLQASLHEPAVGNSFGSSRARILVSTLAPRSLFFESVAVRVVFLPSAACGCAASLLASPDKQAVGNSFGSSRARLLLSTLAARSSCFESVAVRVVGLPTAACGCAASLLTSLNEPAV